MFVIANNVTTRHSAVKELFDLAGAAESGGSEQAIAGLKELAERCLAAGCDALEVNLQQRWDAPEAIEFAVNALQQAGDVQLCLSTGSAQTLEAGLRACKRAPLVNYLSMDERRLGEFLPAVANRGAGVILLVSAPAAPADAREMLQKAAILIGAANEAGIPNTDIMVDPGLIHITGDMGQRHLSEVMEFLRALPDATEPPVRSVCWLSNCSAGAPPRLRPLIESALLPMLAGAGLSAVFMDVLEPENRRAVKLIKVFNGEAVYADAAIES